MRTNETVRRNFTLVELLVVIAIITILAGMLLPALDKARETARNTYCQNNQRQYGAGNEMYADDFSDWYLPVSALNSGGGHTSWCGNSALPGLMGIQRPASVASDRWPTTMICPKATLGFSHAANGYAPLRDSYGMNYTGFDTMTPPHRGYSRPQVKNASGQLCIIDSTDFQVNNNGSDPVKYDTFGEKSDATCWVMTCYRHNRGANVLFYDVHVKWMLPTEIFNNNPLWKFNE